MENTMAKQINVSIAQQDAYKNVLAVAELQQFNLVSEDRILNKVIISYALSQVEIYVEKKSETESVLKVAILDQNGSRTIIPDIAENTMLNFENAFSAVANGMPAAYANVPYKAAPGTAINGILGFIILVVSIIILIYVFFV